MEKLIVSNAFGKSQEFSSLTKPSWQVFSNIHNWKIKINTETNITNREELKLLKLDTIINNLDKCDLLLWLDSDCLITRFDYDISLTANNFQALSLEYFNNRFNPNTGVWLIKNCKESKEFLEEVKNADIGKNYVWVDQSRVMKTLGWNLEPMPYGVKPVYFSKYLENTQWLSYQFNYILGSPLKEEDIVIKHYAGGPNNLDYRLDLLAKDLAELVRSSTIDYKLLDKYALNYVKKYINLKN